MGRFNPHLPTVLGMELPPLVLDPTALDTATEIGYRMRAAASHETVSMARLLTSQPPPGATTRKCVTAAVYPASAGTGTGPMRKVVIPVSSGALGTGATLGGGAASVEAATANPSDLGYVNLSGASSYARMWFAVLDDRWYYQMRWSRIVDVTVRYAMSGPFDQLTTAPVTLSLERASAAVVFDMDDTITGPAAHTDNVVPRRSRLGDLNPFWSTTNNPLTNSERGPWSYLNGANNHVGLVNMNATGTNKVNVRFTTSAEAAGLDFQLHYCALEITYCHEDRLAAGGLDISAGATAYNGMFTYDVPIGSVNSWGQPGLLSVGTDYFVVVGQGYCGAVSQAYPVPITVDRIGTGGEPFVGHEGIIVRKTLRRGEPWTTETLDAMPGVVLFDHASTFNASTVITSSQPYIAQSIIPVDQATFAGEALQGIPDTVAGITYTHMRFYARRQTGTIDELYAYISDDDGAQLGGEVAITPEEWDELPETANGWKQLTLPMTEPFVSTGSGTIYITFYSSADRSQPWEVLAADANPGSNVTLPEAEATYGGDTGHARSAGQDDFTGDAAIALVADMPPVAGLAVTPAVQPLDVVDEDCGLPVDAIPTGIRYHALSWTPSNDVAVQGFGYYEVQRRDTTMAAGVWETIAQITEVTVADMDDYEARVGVVSSYRVRFVHADGYTSAWSSEVTGTIAAPGVTGAAVDASVLVLTSNHNPDGNLAYVMAWEGSALPVQEFTYPEGSQTALQAMYGRDYRVAFRPLERGGVEFTRTLLVNAAGVPAATLSRGMTSLRDLAWDTTPYVCTRDERGNRWLTAVAVPTSQHRDVPRRGHLVLAQATFAEVTDTPAPVDYTAACEGVRLEGAQLYQYWITEDVPGFMGGTRDVTDAFGRTVANGWGSADTGQAWTAENGAASDYSVSGGTGRMAHPTTAVERHMLSAETYGDVRIKMEVVVPAVATGDYYSCGQIVRHQNVNNFYMVDVNFNTDGTIVPDLYQFIGGAHTLLKAGVSVGTYTAGTRVHIEVMSRGTTLMVRAWKDGSARPNWYNDSVVLYDSGETDIGVTGRVGIQSYRSASNTNANLTLQFDNYTVDRLVEEYDLRVQLRPFADQWRVGYATTYAHSGGVADSDGEIAIRFNQSTIQVYWFSGDATTTTLVTTKMLGLKLVRNRLTWVRVVVRGDTGAGASEARFYALNDDGVTWDLVDTVTGQVQPLPPLMPGSWFGVEDAWPGGVWTHQVEVRGDGVLAYNPDFNAQPPGTTAFTDGLGNDFESITAGGAICAQL
jgi:hypothetical protein